MIVQTTADSLVGNRDENQDRLTMIRRDDTLLAAVVDGMGGHDAGAEAAQVAIDSFTSAFDALPLPVTDAQATLSELLKSAHRAIVDLGKSRSIGARPRATCVIALIQNNEATWGHIGDSRVYLLRDGRVVERTRDHSHIEVLLREGLITEDEYRTHPLRNYVEYCLGGEPADPTLALSETHLLKADDLILLCSDGVWSGIEDRDIAHFLCQPEVYRAPEDALETLLHRAVEVCEPVADNTTAALVHWQGTRPKDAGAKSS